MSEQPEIPESTVLVLQIAAANAADLASTTNRLIDSIESDAKRMAQALVDLYDGANESRATVSTPALDRAMMFADAAYESAHRILRRDLMT